MNPPSLLRLEGLAVLAGALGLYLTFGGPLWLLAVLALAPDLSMAGYVAGPRLGSYAYNAAHTYVGPLALGTAGFWGGVELAVLVALVWTAHIGVDRLVGYGLKYPTGFRDTHLTRMAASTAPDYGEPVPEEA